MRLWHKDLIQVLPNKQLMSQWRECKAILSDIENKGGTNHVLVNIACEYPKSHLCAYATNVYTELSKRGYKPSQAILEGYVQRLDGEWVEIEDIYKGWHNKRYLTQCYYNLQEKFDRGGISFDEFDKLEREFFRLMRCEND